MSLILSARLTVACTQGSRDHQRPVSLMCSQKNRVIFTSRATKRLVDSCVNSSLYVKSVFFCHAGNSNRIEGDLRSLIEDTDRMIFEQGQHWTVNKMSKDAF